MKYSIIVKNNGHYERLLYLGYPEARSGVTPDTVQDTKRFQGNTPKVSSDIPWGLGI